MAHMTKDVMYITVHTYMHAFSVMVPAMCVCDYTAYCVHLCSTLACQRGRVLLMVTLVRGHVHQESLFVPPLTCAILLPWQPRVMAPL